MRIVPSTKRPCRLERGEVRRVPQDRGGLVVGYHVCCPRCGFVARSLVPRGGKLSHGSAWIVPANLHPPIRQDAVVLANGRGNAAAGALMAYLKSEQAKAVIRAYGYGI